MTFRYNLVSDLHLDMGHSHGLSKYPFEKNIIVAGDSSNGLEGVSFLQKLQRKGHNIFAVDGNHEHYANRSRGRDVAATEAAFYGLLEQEKIVEINEGLYLIGSNGWYQVEDEQHWRNYMNDSRLCEISAAQVNDLAKRDADFIGNALVKLPHGAKAIVVTHTAPCEQSLDPCYEGSAGNVYYWNPMMEHVLVTCGNQISAWHHGHTHARVDIKHGGVHISTNPRGYPGENKEWEPVVYETL